MRKIILVLITTILISGCASMGDFVPGYSHMGALMVGETKTKIISQAEHVLGEPKIVAHTNKEDHFDGIEARRYNFTTEYDLVLYFYRNIFFQAGLIEPNSTRYPDYRPDYQQVNKDSPGSAGYMIVKRGNTLSIQTLDNTSLFAEVKEDITALAMHQMRWTKSSFRRAKKRLTKVTIGMPNIEFYKIMKMKTFWIKDKPITLLMDGLIFDAGIRLENKTAGKIRTCDFGYVDKKNIFHKKYLVVEKNNEIIDKISLDNYPWKEAKILAINPEIYPTKEEYLRALEYTKDLKPGMWNGEFARIMHMVAIWTGLNVNRGEILTSAEGDFVAVGPGFIRDYSEKRTEEECQEEFGFGYEENGKLFLGFIAHSKNLQFTHIEHINAPYQEYWQKRKRE